MIPKYRAALGGALAGPAVALSLALTLTACTSSHHNSAPPGPSTTGGASSTSTVETPSTLRTTLPTNTASTSSSSSTAPAGPVRCPTSSLAAGLVNGNGAAGSTYYVLQLTNTGSASCVVQGWAGVSFVTGPSGQQVGAPAGRAPTPAPVVTLAPHAAARATLQITVAANYGPPCRSTPVAGLRVYPPNQTAALYIPHSDNACANTNDVTLHVGAFQP